MWGRTAHQVATNGHRTAPTLENTRRRLENTAAGAIAELEVLAATAGRRRRRSTRSRRVAGAITELEVLAIAELEVLAATAEAPARSPRSRSSRCCGRRPGRGA